jgi:hypothetical protein
VSQHSMLCGREEKRSCASAALKTRHPHIPWRQITAFRNVLALGYTGIVGPNLEVRSGKPVSPADAASAGQKTERNHDQS